MTSDVNELNVSELFDYLRTKILILILAAALCGGAAYVVSRYLITPMYTADTKVYILNRADQTGGTVSSQDFNSSTFLTKDYVEIITARPVLEEASDRLGMDISTDELKAKITAANPSDTRYIVIYVTDKDPNTAMRIANAVRVAAADYITRIMDIQAVNTVEPARIPKSPSSPNIKRNTAAGALFGLILLLILFSIRFMTDNKIKTSDDIDRHLGLSVLGVVPRSSSVKERKKA